MLFWRGRVAAAAVGAVVALAALTCAAAVATVKVYDSETAASLGEVRKAKCKLKRDADGRFFVAGSESTNGDFTLNVNVLDWQGFKQDYTFYLGAQDPSFFLTASYGVFSNVYPIPGTPPGAVGAGAVSFRRDGKKLGIGAYLAPNEDFTRGVKFAGSLKCVYPRR